MKTFWSMGTLGLMLSACGDADKGQVGEDDVVVEDENESPTIDLVGPNDGEAFFLNLGVPISVEITDAEDDASTLSLAIQSDVEGAVETEWGIDGDGLASSTVFLEVGIHNLTVVVTDSNGATAETSVSVEMLGPNTDPECEVVSPNSGEWFEVGELIEFVGVVSDAEQSLQELSVEWSDQDGMLTTSTPDANGNLIANIPLLEGTRQVSMQVSDPYGGLCSIELEVNVGISPTLTVRSPTEGEVITHGEIVNLWVDVLDIGPQEVLQETTVQWVSDIDGLVFEGVTIDGTSLHSLDTLSPGVHTLTVTATDEETLTSSESISIRVNRLPEVQTLELDPNPIYTTDALEATVVIVDLDSDLTNTVYQWYENGQLTGVMGSIVPSTDIHSGDEWRLVVTPNDGYINGVSQEISIIVSNTSPSVSNVAIAPTGTVYNDDIVTCTSAAFDPDQTIVPVYQWTVGGTNYISNSIDLSTTVGLPGDTVLCEVFATDDEGVTVSSTDSLVLGNRTPQVSQTTIDVSSPTTNDVVTCSATIVDLDGENLDVEYTWQVGGNTLASGPTVDLSSIAVTPNDSLMCFVEVEDGMGSTANASTTVVVQNTEPVVNTVNITPASPTAVDMLTCTATVSDTDGETLSTVIEFSHQGTILYTQTSQSASFMPTDYGLGSGDSVLCTATTSDGYGGTDQATDSVTLDSSAPSLSNVTISPSVLYTETTATCSGTAIDPNEGNITGDIQYQWEINGNIVFTGSSYTVTSSQSNVGDTVVCRATVTDTDGESDTSTTSTILQNTAPVVNTVTVTPTVPYNDAVLTCSTMVTDPDETPTLAYVWNSNGGMLGTGSTLDLETTSVMPIDNVVCTVTATDGSGQSSTGNTSVMVSNRAPTTPVVTITWSGNSGTPIAGSALSCSGVASDSDGQSLTYTYSWNSSLGGSATGMTISGSQVQGGETWTCVATASDGQLSTSGSSMVNVLEPCSPDTDYESLDLGGFTSAEMVRVCAGTEGLGRYSISKDLMMFTTEVTQGMFVDLMGYDSTTHGSSYGVGTDYPAYYVNWHMAADFANQMTQRHNAVNGTSLNACYTCSDSTTESVFCSTISSCNGYRLPTEAEWEYTARAGLSEEFWTLDGGGPANSSACYSVVSIQDGGATPNLDTFAWYCYNRYNSTNYNTDKPVGLKSPNGFGVHDMHGNVSEWTADRWGCTYPATSVDPLCVVNGSSHTIRGGDWTGNASTIRSSERSSLDASIRTYKQGFRVVRDL
jgi:formylglycine-generating enzyme required for sulfatase activity